MPLAAGDKLGPFEIVGQLGAGGMGEVYRARDSKLKRDVAIKGPLRYAILVDRGVQLAGRGPTNARAQVIE